VSDYRLPVIISVLEQRPTGLSESVAQARSEDLRRFVGELARQYAHQWPEPTAGTRYATGWPACWEQHDGLVAMLRGLKQWHEALERGEAMGPGDIAPITSFIHNEIGSAVREVVRICRQVHRDPSLGIPEVEAETVNTQPPLPGQPPPAERPPARPPSHWSAGLE
jgi:hypothetical protein